MGNSLLVGIPPPAVFIVSGQSGAAAVVAILVKMGRTKQKMVERGGDGMTTL